MRSLRLRFVTAVLAAATMLAPAAASAVTVDQIVALSQAGVTDTVILALIDRDRTIFEIQPEQLVTLKAQGVSEPVILAMLKSGREEGERSAQAAADLNAAFIMSSLSPAPEVVVVGHGPDVPNGGWVNGVYPPPTPGGIIAVPFLYGGGNARRRGHASAFAPPTIDAAGRVFGSPFTVPFTSPFHEPPVAHPIDTQPPRPR